MDTRQYLSQISRMDKMINSKLSELSQLKELSYGLSAVVSEERVQTTPNFDKIGCTISKIDEMERNIDGLVDEYLSKKNVIISQIDMMENETYYCVLFSRYVEKKNFEKMADEMNYSWRQLMRIHKKALREFEKKYGDTYLNN